MGVAQKVKEQLERLRQRGPHAVDVGNLGFTGIKGTIYVPRGVKGRLPLVAFAHDWTKSSRYYTETLRHLASWGFMVVSPDTDSGLLVNTTTYAENLSRAIESAAYATIGRGTAFADVRHIALFGNGIGAGVATVLASYRTDIEAVVAAFPKAVAPSAAQRSTLVDASGLILSAVNSEDSSESSWLGQMWKGPVIHRRLPSAENDGLVERGPLLKGVGLTTGHHATQILTRQYATGFLLATVGQDDSYEAFADPEQKIGNSILITPEKMDEEEAKAAKEALQRPPMWLAAGKAMLGR